MPSYHNIAGPKQAKQLDVGIVIVAHDCPKQLKKLLNSLANQLRRADEVVIIDNHPEHKSSMIAKQFTFVSKILETKNYGFAHGCNTGTKVLSKKIELIFFLNPDTTLKQN